MDQAGNGRPGPGGRTRHPLVAGHNAFASGAPTDAEGPHLLMTPMGKTHLEYFGQGSAVDDGGAPLAAYVQSKAQEEVIQAQAVAGASRTRA